MSKWLLVALVLVFALQEFNSVGGFNVRILPWNQHPSEPRASASPKRINVSNFANKTQKPCFGANVINIFGGKGFSASNIKYMSLPAFNKQIINPNKIGFYSGPFPLARSSCGNIRTERDNGGIGLTDISNRNGCFGSPTGSQGHCFGETNSQPRAVSGEKFFVSGLGGFPGGIKGSYQEKNANARDSRSNYRERQKPFSRQRHAALSFKVPFFTIFSTILGLSVFALGFFSIYIAALWDYSLPLIDRPFRLWRTGLTIAGVLAGPVLWWVGAGIVVCGFRGGVGDFCPSFGLLG